jgi:hypothetical protein
MRVRLTVHPATIVGARLLDVSITGAFVRVDYDLMSPALVSVQVLQEQNRPHVEIPALLAYAVRSNSIGIGLEWCDDAETAAIDALLRLARSEARRGKIGIPSLELSPQVARKAY